MAKLYFYYSAMNAGKSTVLLQSSHNYEERGMGTLLLTPDIDHRDGVGVIATRVGLKKQARAFSESEDLFALCKHHLENNPNTRCVLVDEAQFLSKEQVFGLARFVDECGVPVLAYGLRADYRATPFPGSTHLLAIADELIELKTICHCGRKATMNMRIDEDGRQIKDGQQVVIGGNEAFVATCRRCFFKGDSGK